MPPATSIQSKTVGIFVCTRGYSPELQACVKSILDQEVSDGWKLDAINIIWNTSEEEALEAECHLLRDLGDLFSDSAPLRHFYENSLGIPFARSSALEVARSTGLGWVLFVDDDCLARPDLLEKLTSSADATGADVVAGGWELVPDGRISTWLPPQVFGRKDYRVDGLSAADGDELPTAYTRNVMFRVAATQADDTTEFHFRELHPGAGGSDVLFFYALSLAGKKIVYAREAMVAETYSGRRLTLRWHLLRRIRTAQQRHLRKEFTGEVGYPVGTLTGLFREILHLPLLVVLFPGSLFSQKVRRWIGMKLWRLSPYFGIAVLVLGFSYREYQSGFSFRAKVRRGGES
jgi:hypothetical protein